MLVATWDSKRKHERICAEQLDISGCPGNPDPLLLHRHKLAVSHGDSHIFRLLTETYQARCAWGGQPCPWISLSAAFMVIDRAGDQPPIVLNHVL